MAITALVVGPSVSGNASVAYPGSAGDVKHNRFSVAIPASTAIGTAIEIGVIPPGCRVVDAILETPALAGVTVGVGVIADSRTPPAPPGSNSAADLAARTVGTEFFAAGTSVAAAAATRMTAAGGFQVAPAGYERGIGLTLAGAITPASVQVVTLAVWLAAA